MKLVECSDDLIPAAVMICKDEYEQSTLKGLPFNGMKLIQGLIDCSQRNFLRLAMNDNAEIIGIIAGYIDSPPWTDAKIGNQMVWYVRQTAKNKGLAARLLMDAFCAWCREQGASIVISGVLVNIDNYGADVMHRRLGFSRDGTLYVKQLT